MTINISNTSIIRVRKLRSVDVLIVVCLLFVQSEYDQILETNIW